MTKRQRIYNKTGGRCIYCGVDLAKGWHADHFVPVLRDGNFERNGDGVYAWKTNGKLRAPRQDTEENLVPSCASCNIDKASNSIYWWRSSIARTTETLKTKRAYRFAIRYGLLQETGGTVVFWFETAEGKAVIPKSVLRYLVAKTDIFTPDEQPAETL